MYSRSWERTSGIGRRRRHDKREASAIHLVNRGLQQPIQVEITVDSLASFSRAMKLA